MSSFHRFYDRRNTRSLKWDHLQAVFQTEDILPMWVADMDFKVPQQIIDALAERVEHGIYGYTIIDQKIKDTVINWIQSRHQWKVYSDSLLFSPGVIPSINASIQAFTEINDKVLIQTPVYTPFYDVIRDLRRQVVTNPLVLKDNYYQINFDDFEKQLKKGVKAFILCSPHNPVGRVWKEKELRKMANLCIKYNVLILSDEIHGDIIYPEYKHIPTASLSKDISEQTITFMSPSKTFNIAGLHASYLITESPDKHLKMKGQFKNQGFMHLNTMGITALEAAYTYGGEWLDQLIDTLTHHRSYVMQMLRTYTEELQVIVPEGTYLMWINCKKLQMDHKTLQKFMIEKAKVGLNPGISYGVEGNQFMRMNIACPLTILEKGMKRIITAVNKN